MLHKCVFFRFKLFPRQVIFLFNVPKKEIQFLFRLGLNAIKRLWCNANIQMLSAFSSITVNFYSKNFVFQYMHLFCVLLKITVPVHQGNIHIKLRDHQLVYEVEKRINNSSKFLDLDRNMLMWVLLKLCSFSSAILTLWPMRHFST